jgi:hypothetical protein
LGLQRVAGRRLFMPLIALVISRIVSVNPHPCHALDIWFFFSFSKDDTSMT